MARNRIFKIPDTTLEDGKAIREIPNAKLLEDEKGIIRVKRKIEFRRNGEKKPCSNCNNSTVPKTIYEMEDGRIIEICFFCNQKFIILLPKILHSGSSKSQ